MLYVILNGAFEDRADVTVVMNPDGTAMVFKDRTEAQEWAEENLNFWHKVVSV